MTDSARPSNPGSAGEPPNAGAVPSSGRRRLLRAGISATPIALTLSSRPVLAWQCRSPSANASGNASNPGQTFSAERTRTIGEWAATTEAYPQGSNIVKNSTLFSAVFPGGSAATVTSVLSSGTDFEKYMAAAALNIYYVPTVANCLTLPELQEMWAGRNGTYSPVSGVAPWGTTQIKFYLQSNYIVTG